MVARARPPRRPRAAAGPGARGLPGRRASVGASGACILSDHPGLCEEGRGFRTLPRQRDEPRPHRDTAARRCGHDSPGRSRPRPEQSRRPGRPRCRHGRQPGPQSRSQRRDGSRHLGTGGGAAPPRDPAGSSTPHPAVCRPAPLVPHAPPPSRRASPQHLAGPGPMARHHHRARPPRPVAFQRAGPGHDRTAPSAHTAAEKVSTSRPRAPRPGAATSAQGHRGPGPDAPGGGPAGHDAPGVQHPGGALPSQMQDDLNGTGHLACTAAGVRSASAPSATSRVTTTSSAAFA